MLGMTLCGVIVITDSEKGLSHLWSCPVSTLGDNLLCPAYVQFAWQAQKVERGGGGEGEKRVRGEKGRERLL